MDEYFFQCPYCWEQISMLIDTSQKQQNYIEDCEICCNPIQIELTIENQEITSFQANSIEQ
ncbi:CPXCG motif-containing cysteine-rich protein [Winogradskyella echinorum]|uniref:CPXCG motif-containing cysteine-rich protein n=1 Tax=Winogradskyella echinorum TaxID=538189 RepID=A0ABR6XX14_9FLAO|nr:CPXCG motif-containing cysteine-rich protein [Winogradskyella echinorum]MBC3845031.1 CPXCG motif-containing cysteine-rich protein [Winogradskyella echinorum]MBC5749379.1 CPXCG motif-containing cysteine-rich protein [Winogradskyella echinorum]